MDNKRNEGALMNLNLFRSVIFYVGLAALVLSSPVRAQEKLPPLSERVLRACDQVLVVNDLNVVKNDVLTILNDFGMGTNEDDLEDWFPTKDEVGLSLPAGMVVYWDKAFSETVREFRVTDRSKLLSVFDSAEGETEVPENAWTEIKRESGIPLIELLGQRSSAMIDGDRFIVARRKSDEFAKRVKESKPLAEWLNPVGHGIINSSGLTFIGLGDKVDAESIGGFARILVEAEMDLTAAEQEWLKKFADAASRAKAGLVGLKYHPEKVFEVRAQAILRDDVSLSELFYLQHSNERWNSDLGFEPEQLVLSAAMKLDSFKSSGGMRAVAHVLLEESGSFEQSEFLRGSMLKLLVELVGDSWNDLTAARIGLYQNDESEKVGQMAIISVVDSYAPERVMEELAKISQLTTPTLTEEQVAAQLVEVKKLIADLESDDPNVSARAETRLRIAGQVSIDEIAKAKSGLSDKAQKRAKRVVRRIEYRLKETKKPSVAVLNPSFWTTLSPGLELKQNTGTLAGFSVHSIVVTPDASKSPKEVASAIGVMTTMFGENWNDIKVVQVKNHFVFMVGSDEEALLRAIKNVDKGSSLLMTQLENAGYGSKTGQLQTFVNMTRFNRMFNITSWLSRKDENKKMHDDKLCWLGITFNERTVGAEVLVPLKQIGETFFR